MSERTDSRLTEAMQRALVDVRSEGCIEASRVVMRPGIHHASTIRALESLGLVRFTGINRRSERTEWAPTSEAPND